MITNSAPVCPQRPIYGISPIECHLLITDIMCKTSPVAYFTALCINQQLGEWLEIAMV